MSDFEDYRVERSAEEKRRSRWELFKIIGFGLIFVGFVAVGYEFRESRIDELMGQLEYVRQAPQNATLPAGWRRDVKHSHVQYHSPPVSGEICTKITRTTFEPPQGIRVHDVGRWCNTARMNVMTFSEPRTQR